MSEWHPIEDLPKNDFFPVVFYSDGFMYSAHRWLGHKIAFLIETNGEMKVFRDEKIPTHWMPLPKPPKESKEDE